MNTIILKTLCWINGIKNPFVWFSRKTDWKCESCINYGCVANNSICDYCNGENHYEYDIQGFSCLAECVRRGIPLPKKRLIDADELLKRIDKVAKKPSLSIDTINGLCGAVAIIYDMLIETGQEKGEEE